MDVVGDMLARDRRSRDPALVTPDGRERTYRDLITNAYKSANVLRHLGARTGSTVAVDPVPGFHTTLAFLGAAGLGAPVRCDPAAGVAAEDRVVLVPTEAEHGTDPAPGTSLAVFGGPPARADTTHWEAELWSENPATPPSDVAAADPVIRDGADDVSHRRLLDVADAVTRDHGIGSGTRVVIRTTFADPLAVAVGLVAPLARGGVSVLAPPEDGGSERAEGSEEAAGSDDREPASTAHGDLAVVADADADPPEPNRIVLPRLAGRLYRE